MLTNSPFLATQYKCPQHSEQIIAIDQTGIIGNKEGFCLQCLIDLKKGWILPLDAHNQIEQIKQEVKEKQRRMSEKNIQILKTLVQQIESLKIQFNKSLDQLINHILQWTSSLQEENYNFQQFLQTSNTIFVNKFKQDLNNLKKQGYESHSNYKTIMKDQLLELQQTENIQVIFGIVNKIEVEYSDWVEQQEEIFQKQQQLTVKKHLVTQGTPKLDLICKDHNKEIIMIDIHEFPEKYNRLGCIFCVQDHPLQYTGLTIVQEKWKTNQKLRINRLNNYTEQLEIQKQSQYSFLETVEKKIQESANALNLIQDTVNIQLNKVFRNMNSDWLQLSKEEVQSISEELSHNNFYNVSNCGIQSESDLVKSLYLSLRKLKQGEKLFSKNIVANCQQLQKEESGFQVNRLYDQIYQIIFCILEDVKKSESQEELQLIEIDQRISEVIQKGISKSIEKSIFSQSDLNTFNVNENANYWPVQITDRKFQKNKCNAIAFNGDSSIMVAASLHKIKIYDFKQGKLKLVQVVGEHTRAVTTLCFMKKSNRFISGSNDCSIIIWSIDYNQWYPQQRIKKAHLRAVNCVILNQMEDLIISCSDDSTIKFWVQNKNDQDEIQDINEDINKEWNIWLNQGELGSFWKCSQSLQDHTAQVDCISLNKSQNQLVSCGYDGKILISQIGKNNIWKNIQIIVVDEIGTRLCFVEDHIITFQPWNQKQMLAFSLDQEKKEFILSNKTPVSQFQDCQYYFPQIYNREKEILLNKNGQTINLLRKQTSGDFVVELEIKFEIENIWGTMTDNGEYLVTWDSLSSQFQVRKFIN